MLLKSISAILLSLVCILPIRAGGQADEQRAILAVLDKSADDWNRGDLEAFARSYKDGSDTELVGSTNVYGFNAILERYRKHYANRTAMGKLTFSDEDVRQLDDRFATVTAHFHLV